MDNTLRINLLQICVAFLSFSTSAFGSRNSLVVDLHALTTRDVCYPPKGTETLTSVKSTLKVLHRYGPCSTLPPVKKWSLEQILAEDQSRVDFIHHRVSTFSSKDKGLTSSQIAAESGNSYNLGNYIVSVGFGTPSKTLTLEFDTGSEVTWIQCKPCQQHCYAQKQPIFDPSNSSTFANVPCTSTPCKDLILQGCSGSSCLYGVEYGDGSYTVGYYVEDTLTIGSDVIQNFRFGCGQNNTGLFGEVAGLLGLGPAAESFVSQTLDKYGGVFAYCLPASSSTGYLTFGRSSDMSKTNRTPIPKKPNPLYYYISMTGITVNSQTLQIASTVFSNAGMIIDSGTVISRLPPDAYQALRSAFRERMKQYKMAPGTSLLDTCYDFTGVDNLTNIPSIGFQFLNGVSLDLNGILIGSSISQVCLGFAANSNPSDLAIFGNLQQTTFEVVYDIPNGEIGFSPNAC